MAMNQAQAEAAMSQPITGSMNWVRNATDFLDRMAGRYWKANTLGVSLDWRKRLQEHYRESAAQPRPGDPIELRQTTVGSNPGASLRAYNLRQKSRAQVWEPYIEGELPYDPTQYAEPSYGGYGGYGGYGYQPYYGGGGGGGGGGYGGGSYTPKKYLPQAYNQQDWGAQVEQEQRGYGESGQLTLWNI